MIFLRANFYQTFHFFAILSYYGPHFYTYNHKIFSEALKRLLGVPAGSAFYVIDVDYGLPIVYGRPYCNDAKEGVGGITPPKLNRGG